MLEEIKTDLGENFREGDEMLLNNFIDEATTDALSISNREKSVENINLLKSNIKEYVKSKYLLRGSEGLSSLSDSGISSSFLDIKEKLRHDIVNEGKRKVF